MKRFIPLLASMLIGCSSPRLAQPEMRQPVVEQKSQSTVIDKNSWTITLPSDWKYDDSSRATGKLTKHILTAETSSNVGREPIILSINEILYQKEHAYSEEQFGIVVATEADNLFGGELISSQHVQVDGHFATVTLLIDNDSSGMLVLATARGPVGYIVSCKGDALKPTGNVVSKTCIDIMKTFHAK